MGLTDLEAQARINNMIMFIMEDTEDKLEEIERTTEQEFLVDKENYRQAGLKKVKEHYDKLESRVLVEAKVKESKSINTARINFLSLKYNLIRDIIVEAHYRLSENRTPDVDYRETVLKMILQGLFLLTERKIMIRCIKSERRFVQSLLPDCTDSYRFSTGREVSIKIDTDHYLPAHVYGGVVLYARNDRIKVNNTLKARLDQVAFQILPCIVVALLGPNPNRRFLE